MDYYGGESEAWFGRVDQIKTTFSIYIRRQLLHTAIAWRGILLVKFERQVYRSTISVPTTTIILRILDLGVDWILYVVKAAIEQLFEFCLFYLDRHACHCRHDDDDW